MSHGYVPVQWNKNKKVYDILVLVGVVLAIVLHLVTAGGAAGAEAPSDEIMMLRALGDTAFVLLNIIMAIGPLARLNPRFLPLLYNRRHMGVTFFVIALAHGAFALVWYHGFGIVDPLTSLFTSQGSLETVSDYRFQPLGFFALVIFFLMAATSHDFWNAVLGPGFWKALHMLIYVAYGLIILHLALGAVQSEHSALPTWVPFASLLWVGALHVAALLKPYTKPVALVSADWIEIEDPQTIARGAGKVFEMAGDERIAVFRTEDDQFGAISNVCRHQAGPLGEGCIKDGLVTCPWHGFQYQLQDGASPPPFEEKVSTHEMSLNDGKLYLNPEPLPPGTSRPLVAMTFGDGDA